MILERCFMFILGFVWGLILCIHIETYVRKRHKNGTLYINLADIDITNFRFRFNDINRILNGEKYVIFDVKYEYKDDINDNEKKGGKKYVRRL